MLQLLPALLLLMLQGPATLDRGALSERWPQAVRMVLEARPSDDNDAEFDEAPGTIDWVASSAQWSRSTAALAYLLGLHQRVEPTERDSEPPEPRVAQSEFDEPVPSRFAARIAVENPSRAGP